MKWNKQGLIWRNPGFSSWAQSSVMVPTPHLMDDKTLRFYAGFRDADGVSRIGFIDVDSCDFSRILSVSQEPVLDIGTPGAFDDNGVVPSCLVERPDGLYLYYFAFQLGVRVRYFMYSGLARSTDGGRTFTRVRRTPILERNDADMIVRSGQFVMQDEGRWRSWYVAGTEFTQINGKDYAVYNIKRLESPNGVDWPGDGAMCLSVQGDEFGLGRPFVVKGDRGYEMLFAVRSPTAGYKIGYAESPDGAEWRRDDSKAGIDYSPGSWDSDMLCYHSVFQLRGETYLFYCGNNFGEQGFGCAKLEGAI